MQTARAIPGQTALRLKDGSLSDASPQQVQRLEEDRVIFRLRNAARHWSPRLLKRIRDTVDELLLPYYRAQASDVLEFLNRAKGGRGFDHSATNLNLIARRLIEGTTVEEAKAIITVKERQTREKRPDGRPVFDKRHLRPATLFGKTLHQQYLGELGE